MGSNAEIQFELRVSPRDLPELMDGDCSYEDFRGCLRSLEQINRWLLGYRPTLAWLRRLPPAPPDPLHIVDVGSGGGDLLRPDCRLGTEARHFCAVNGIDLNPYAARAAVESTPKQLGIAWVTGNALEYRPEKPVDIVVSSLTAHHLEDKEIVALLRWMEATAQVGWFINDLERSKWNSRCLGGWSASWAGTGLSATMRRSPSGGPPGAGLGAVADGG